MSCQAANTDEEIEGMIGSEADTYTTDSNEDTFKLATVFESFHYQAMIQISVKALLAGFFMLPLKRRVVLMLPHESITVNVVYPVVQLALANLSACFRRWFAVFMVDCVYWQ